MKFIKLMNTLVIFFVLLESLTFFCEPSGSYKKPSLKARFHLFFGGKTLDLNGIGFTEKKLVMRL